MPYAGGYPVYEWNGEIWPGPFKEGQPWVDELPRPPETPYIPAEPGDEGYVPPVGIPDFGPFP